MGQLKIHDMDLKAAMKIVIKELRNDPDLYQSWQSNIAMAFRDEYDRQQVESAREHKGAFNLYSIANNAARKFLTLLTSTAEELNGND